MLKKEVPGLNIFVEDGAGTKINIPNSEYQKAGAEIVTHDEALKKDMILGVKETKPEDYPKLGGSIWLSYQHFAGSRKRTELALKSKTVFVALETIEEKKNGRSFFPCLAPMSEAAGRIVVRHADVHALLKMKTISSGLSQTGKKGLKAVIIGSGTVGRTAAEEFKARGYNVEMLGRSSTTPEKLKAALAGASFVVSAMYTSGKCPEKIVKKEYLKLMAENGCAYPVDIDQGGGIEGAAETSVLELFDLPKIEGTDVYCFAPPNIPSLGARTTSEALGNAVLPYVIRIIKQGVDSIGTGINIRNGKIIHPGLASVFPDL